MDPARRPESHDPEFPPAPYTRRPPHPPSRDTRYDRPPFLTSVEQYPPPYVDLEKRDGLSNEPRPGGSRTPVDQPLVDDAQEKPPLSRTRWGGAKYPGRPPPHTTRTPEGAPCAAKFLRGPDSQYAGFPEAGSMTRHPYPEQDTGSSGPYRMEWP